MLFFDFLQEKRCLVVSFYVLLLGLERLDPILSLLNFLQGPMSTSSQLSVCYTFYKCYKFIGLFFKLNLFLLCFIDHLVELC